MRNRFHLVQENRIIDEQQIAPKEEEYTNYVAVDYLVNLCAIMLKHGPLSH